MDYFRSDWWISGFTPHASTLIIASPMRVFFLKIILQVIKMNNYIN